MKESKGDKMVSIQLLGSQGVLQKAIAELEKERQIKVRPWSPYGGWPVPLARIVGEGFLEKYVAKRIPIKRLEGINGGEEVAHFHLGNDIIFLESDDFKTLVGEIALKLATDLAGKVDYSKTVDLVGQFAIDTVPLPEHQASPRR